MLKKGFLNWAECALWYYITICENMWHSCAIAIIFQKNKNMAGPEARDFCHSIRVGTKGSGRRPRNKLDVKWLTKAYYGDKY